jgi:hypothetical protein
MTQRFQIHVFGKPGCDKCALLNERIDKLLAQEDWRDFGKTYFSLDTEEGLVAFSQTECINPQRVPAFLVAERRDESDTFRPVCRKEPEDKSAAGARSRLRPYLGLQTDYGPEGKGVISPRMIAEVLTEARDR